MASLNHWLKLLGLRDTAEDFVRVRRELLIADRWQAERGYTWTLASVLSELLAEAEEKYGLRDSSYCFLGVEFNTTGPRVWFPGNRNHIVIQLSLNSLTNGQTAQFELAHECIHLLSPGVKPDATVLEEGLATAFSIDITERYHGKGWWSNCNNSVDYFAAAVHARSLLALDSEIIKKMRQEEPHISSITAEMILRHCPLAGEVLAQALSAKFLANEQI